MTPAAARTSRNTRFCTDSERLLHAVTQTNTRLERSAVIVSANSQVTVMQFARIIRESNHPDRRMFYEADAMHTWLAEVLNPLEAKRLQEFSRTKNLRHPTFDSHRYRSHNCRACVCGAAAHSTCWPRTH
jgi:hypothetical protein